MLTLSLLSVYITLFIVLATLVNSVKNKYWTKSKSTLKNSTLHSIEECENMGTWNFFIVVAKTLLYSREDPTHQDTVFVKIYEHLKQTTIINSKLKAKLFGTTNVLANSEKSIREYLCNENCGNRFTDSLYELLYDDHSKGIMLGHGNAAWKELRKYTLKTLSKLGFGKNEKMSVILDDSLNDFLEELETCRKNGGNIFPVQESFCLSVVNIVWLLVGGMKFKKTDEKYHKLETHMKQANNDSTTSVMMGCITPKFIHRIMQLLRIAQPLPEYSRRGHMIFSEYIDEIEMHGGSIRNSDESEDNFVSLFLLNIEKYENDEQMSKIYSKRQLASVLNDLFGASIDTTSKFLECSFMYMVMYPDIQKRLQHEIDDVVGICVPSYSSHNKVMPYTQAVVMEIHRMANIVPVYPRTVSRDSKIGNDTFNKNTLIVINNTSMNMDEKYWGDPKVFRPERFLDADENILIDKVNYMMPFGAGMRVCPGENVAKAAIFIFLVGILQRYTLVKSIEEEFLGLSKATCVTSGPEPFHVSLFPR